MQHRYGQHHVAPREFSKTPTNLSHHKSSGHSVVQLSMGYATAHSEELRRLADQLKAFNHAVKQFSTPNQIPCSN